MKNVRLTICLMVAVLFMASGQGFGSARFNDGGTHNINYIDDDVWVDYLAPGMQTTVNLLNGASISSLEGYNDSRINISGGSMYYLSAWDNSQVTISGGYMYGWLSAWDSSLVNWSGGTIAQDLRLDNAATLTIYGSNFAIDGNPFSFGEIASILGGSYDTDPFRRLTGTLANGGIINKQFRIGNNAEIVLIPEPATLLLLGLGGFVLRRKRR